MLNLNELLNKENELIHKYENDGFIIIKDFSNKNVRFVKMIKRRKKVNITRFPVEFMNKAVIELTVNESSKFGFILTEKESYITYI